MQLKDTKKRKSVRTMTIRGRIESIGIPVSDAIIETLLQEIDRTDTDPVISLCALVYLFTDSTINDVKKLLKLRGEKYKNAEINRGVKSLLSRAKITKRRQDGETE